MADITKCNSEQCSRKETCYRYLAEDSQWQSWAEFETICNEDNGFEEYIPVDDRK